jgi:Zn-dependent metalloprotease
MYPKLPDHRSLLGLLTFACLFTSLRGSAQKNPVNAEALKQAILQDKKVSDVSFSPERQTPSLIVFDSKRAAYKLAEVPVLLHRFLNLRDGYDNMVLQKNVSLCPTLSVAQYQQFFRGVKVEYSVYKGLSKNADVTFLSGSFYEIPAALSVIPSVTPAQALAFAKQQINAKKYAWEDIQDKIAQTKDPRVKKALSEELRDYLPTAELVIVKDFTREDIAEMRLAYKLDVYASQPLSRGYIYIDAHTGKTLLYNSIIKHASVPTTVTTRYAGNRTIYTKQISGNDPNNGLPIVSSHPATEPTYVPGSPTYVLIDDTRGSGVETYDANNVQGLPITLGDFAIYAQGKSFTDVDNNWTLTEHKRGITEGGAAEAENDDVAWDAHWGAGVVYDYWKNKQGRLSYDGNNSKIISYVHYGPAYDNAFWNGRVMTYGDGSGNAATGFKTLTSLDVCGHEIGHGVCSSTSDLVYANESGAMNEGFSDIWAASIENYAIKFVDPTLSTRYKPFQIGEQIGFGAEPALRRMDNPKVKGDPDTYRGQYWVSQNCTPTLANDECGVHTNSNVLNKWYYLLTLGSGAGSGPDASYVAAGADDGLRDDTLLGFNSVPYAVTGLGFDIAEKIAFITETMLSSTATFAEARTVSIAAATAYSGDACGSYVQSVINAWHAVGVGNKFTGPCTSTFGFVFQNAARYSEGLATFGCNAQRTVNLPVLFPSGSTATVTFGGTATQGQDYTVSASSFSNPGGTSKLDTLKVFINNDAVIESDETIIINISITNTGGSPTNTSYTITIADDDAIPVIGSDSVTIMSENFDAYTSQGFAGPNTWTETLEVAEDPTALPTANGKNQWGVLDGTLSITGRLDASATVKLPTGTYYNTSVSQTKITSPLIDARGLTNLRIRFDYTVQGEVDPNGTDIERYGKFDYMEVLYTIDANDYTVIDQFASAAPVSGTYVVNLPSELNNKQFRLVFRWVNDTNAGGPVSVKVDNLSIKAVPRKIESQSSHSGNEKVGPNQDVYFLSQNDGEIIARINNSQAFDYGCVTASLEKAGSSSFTLYTDGTGNHKVGDKFVRVIPTTNNATGSYSISLYFTEAEIQAIEAATLQPRTAFYIYKTSAAGFASATSSNTTRAAAVYTAINGGVGGIFTAAFTTGFSGFALGTVSTGVVPITCLSFNAAKSANGIKLSWNVAQEVSNNKFEIERSTDGVNFSTLTTVMSDTRNAGVYSVDDNAVTGLREVFYRLKQIDRSGSSKYICSVVNLKLDSKALFTIGNVYPNPVKGEAFVKVTSSETKTLSIETINNIGQLIDKSTQRISAGTTNVQLKLKQSTAGTYMVRFKDEDGNVLSSQTIIFR